MIKLAIAVFVGLMLGWCFIPQPKWAQPLWDKFSGVIKGLPSRFISKKDTTDSLDDKDDDRKFKV